MKRTFKVLGILIGFFVIAGTIMFLSISSNMRKIRELEIRDIDFSIMEDGTYIGEFYYKDQIGATIEIVIENGEFTSANISDHIYGLGGDAEFIVGDIIDEQTILVDDIAGATTSSHVIKLAIQNALEEQE